MAAEYTYQYQQHLKGLVIFNMMMNGQQVHNDVLAPVQPVLRIRTLEAKRLQNPRWLLLPISTPAHLRPP
jgi:hypothetical protein